MFTRLVRISLLSTLVLFVACDEEDDNIFGNNNRINISTFGYDTEQRGVWFEVEDVHPISVVECTNYARLYAVESGGDRLLEPIDEIVNRREGYYLDGGFVPPDLAAGCDAPECVPATHRRFFATNLEYEVVGTRPVPGEYENHFPENWDKELPTELPDVESDAYEGPARISLSYYPQDDCSYDLDALVTSFAVFINGESVAPRR